MPEAGAATWTDPAWREAHVAWATGVIAASGRTIIGPTDQVHVRPWSTLFAFSTETGRLWSKADGAGTRHEAAVLARLQQWGAPYVLPVLGVDEAQGWLVMPDGGTRLRDTRPNLNGDHDLAVWERLLPIYATLPRLLESRVDDLLEAGVPDEHPECYPAILAGLLDDERIWDRVDAAEQTATAAARTQLRGTLPGVARLADELASSGLTITLDHGDVHGGNILIDPSGSPWFYDWGDSAVAHPFATLTWSLASIGEKVGLAPGSSGLRRLRDAYIEAWTDRASRAELAEIADLAVLLGWIGKAAAWERALFGLTRDAMDGHHGATAEVLVVFRDRLAARLDGQPASR